MPFSQHHIKGTCYQYDSALLLTLISWLRECCQASVLSILWFWKEVTMHSPHLRMKSYDLPVEGKVSTLLLEILLHGRFVYSLPFIYSFNTLFISVWTHRYQFYTLSYNPLLLYIFWWSYCSSFGHWAFLGLTLLSH